MRKIKETLTVNIIHWFFIILGIIAFIILIATMFIFSSINKHMLIFDNNIICYAPGAFLVGMASCVISSYLQLKIVPSEKYEKAKYFKTVLGL